MPDDNKRNKFVKVSKNVYRRNNTYYLYAIDNKSMCKKRVRKKYIYNKDLATWQNDTIATNKQKEFEQELNYTIKLKTVLKEYEKVILSTKKANTINQYKHYINNYIVGNNILNYDIDKLTTMMLLDYLNSIKKINARYNVMCILKQIFLYAYTNSYTDKNIMIFINAHNTNTYCFNDKISKKKEQLYNITDLLEYFNEEKNIDYIVIILLLTGLRIGELLALQTQDINTQNRVITVNKNLSYINKEFIIDRPKTRSSTRKIIYSSVLDNLINRLLEQAQTKKSILLVSDKKGQYIKYNSLAKALKTRTKESKYNKLHLHMCRKIYINACINLELEPYEIANRIGHSDIQTIVNNYYNYS